MTTIRIENLGPIIDSSTVELTPLLILMGPQSAGKSTFMKALCFCRWVEKRIMVSTVDMVNQYTHYGRFIKEFKLFHRMDDSFFSRNTRIYYESEMLSITYLGENKNPRIVRKRGFQNGRFNTKLSYIPAERNLVSSFRNIDRAYRSSDRDVLFNLIYEWDEAKAPYTRENAFPLSVTGGFQYVNKNGEDTLLMRNGMQIPAFYASSGLQSVMPLEVMSRYFLSLVGARSAYSKHDLSSYISSYLMDALNGDDKIKETRLPDEMALESLKRRFIYQSAQLYIEEPEQNLYPESQKLLMFSLVKSLGFAQKNGSQMSSIVLTTHSPYVLSVINVLFRAAVCYEKTRTEAVHQLIEEDLLLPSNSFSAYFIKEGLFSNVLDSEIPLFSGNELDGVSDWVDEKIAGLNDLMYGA